MISKNFYKFRKYPENAKCQPYCRTPELIENYDLAMADKERTWMCHHKLEAFYTSKELKEIGRYYNVPPRELVFVRDDKEHKSWPHKGTKQQASKMSIISKSMGLSPPNLKETHWYNNGIENVRCIECPDGYVQGRLVRPYKKNKGLHWFNDGSKNIMAEICPDGFIPGKLIHKRR